ncbi:choline ABC transporter ATP-binding protein [Devosia psychrophila]|jgi:glycine betaine/proline transport system ATP-binding protein|uniref:Glycine betaine/proline transport system ATP-binding protein n=1 Tax=Devosia psychrophila TaxID=728005 RepID=A0A0F5PUX1_9HYPH|nr:choline ABC transporter ATP-binding protein [Devosia psychrophila]KKC32428.1 hemolysin [Devosia psychrophila]SFC13197.1 glycine betaine/proline transport system ATP-binding protein [Devosia psychrophila]
MEDAVIFDKVNIVFGTNPDLALPLMDAGKTRQEIQRETKQILGVHDCSLTVKKGEILVLMGLSGSGKSTLLRAVNGLNPVVRGSVQVIDQGRSVNPAACSRDELLQLRRKSVAMVFQQFGLLPWRTVLDNVGLGLELDGLSKLQRNAKVRSQLELVGLSDWADRNVGQLSGGMQQRVGLARAFATEAPILLMDEPFSALDPLIRSRLQDELLELQEKLKRTIIFVSHDLDEAFKLGDRIALMEGGRIVQCGTPQEIIANPVDDYVEDFVAHMNPLNVLRAMDIMSPDIGSGVNAVPSHSPLAAVIEQLSAGAPSVCVRGPDGQLVGSIYSKNIVTALRSKPARVGGVVH